MNILFKNYFTVALLSIARQTVRAATGQSGREPQKGINETRIATFCPVRAYIRVEAS